MDGSPPNSEAPAGSLDYSRRAHADQTTLVLPDHSHVGMKRRGLPRPGLQNVRAARMRARMQTSKGFKS